MKVRVISACAVAGLALGTATAAVGAPESPAFARSSFQRVGDDHPLAMMPIAPLLLRNPGAGGGPTVTGAPQLVATGAVATGSSGVAAYPAGIQANDIAIIYVHALASSGSLTFNVPSGWTQIDQQQVAVANRAHAAFWKRLTGSETGSVTVTTNIGATVTAGMTVWRGCLSSGSPVEGSNHAQQTVTTAVIGAPTRTIASPDRTLVHCYASVDGAPTFTPGSEYTVAWQDGATTKGGLTYRYLTVPIDVAETGSLSATDRWGVVYFSLIPQTVVSSSTPYANDPFRNYVKLQVGFDGSIIDESPIGRTLTANGNAQVSTSSPLVGTGSGLFDGSGDYITALDSTDFDFARKPFTIRGKFKLSTKTNSQAFVGQWDNAGTFANCAFFFFIQSGNLTLRIANGSSTFDVIFGWTPTLGQEYDLQADRDITGKTRLYIDGAMVASGTNQNIAPNNSTNVLSIARIGTGTTFSSFDYNGRMDELEITVGIARCGSDSGFTPSSSARPRA
jgi:hypothetical protein